MHKLFDLDKTDRDYFDRINRINRIFFKRIQGDRLSSDQGETRGDQGIRGGEFSILLLLIKEIHYLKIADQKERIPRSQSGTLPRRASIQEYLNIST